MRVLYVDQPEPLRTEPPPTDPHEFHRAIGEDQPTPLLSLHGFAEALGVGAVDMKLETCRVGLPSFKVMGASWAAVTAMRPFLPDWWQPDLGLIPLHGALPDLTLVAATEGNHGHAIARIGKIVGLHSRILVPSALSDARVETIANEGAEVIRVDGSYDEAVDQSAKLCVEDKRLVLVSDTSWPGYERVPSAVIDGYSTILQEISSQLAATGRRPPDLVIVPLGVGAFGAAVIRHFRGAGSGAPVIVGVEPGSAACVMASLAAGRRVTVPGPHVSAMTGLNCGTPSYVAWPYLRDGLDAVVAIEDEAALSCVRALAAEGVAVGACSGAGLAAAQALLSGPASPPHRARLGIRPDSSVLVFATEGVTDRNDGG